MRDGNLLATVLCPEEVLSVDHRTQSCIVELHHPTTAAGCRCPTHLHSKKAAVPYQNSSNF